MESRKDTNLLLVAVAAVLASIMLSALPGPARDRHRGPQVLSWAFLGENPILLWPLLALAMAGGVWWAVERQPRSRSVAVQYEPPPDLSPAEAGALLEDSVKRRAIVSTMVDLAVRGYLSIEPANSEGSALKSKDYVFRNLQRPRWATELSAHERDLVQHIFEYGEQPSLGALWHGLPDYSAQIKEHVFKSLIEKNMYFLSPALGGVILLFGGFAVLLLLWFLAMALGIHLAAYNVLNPICFGLAMVVIFLFSRKTTLKSALGKERWCQVKGFQEFMGRVDAQRMKAISPDLFEKFLPYAIALGVETEWAATFQGMLTRPLSWYTGALAEFLLEIEE